MEYLITFLVLLLVVMMMACGVVLTGKRIEGSCGGVWQEKGSCKICGSETRAECADGSGNPVSKSLKSGGSVSSGGLGNIS